MTQPPPAAGWYPDPSGQGQRYWDGSNWGPTAPTASGTNAPVEKKRRWPWIVVAVFVAIIAIAAIGGNDSKNANTSSSGSSGSSPAPAAASVGQEVRDGKFAFTVTSVDTSDIAGDPSNQFERVQAQGKFINVQMTVVNTGDRPQTFSASDQKLIAGGKQFGPNNEAALWTHSWNVEINPGNSIPAVISFDVPPGSAATGGVLELHDSALSGGAKVNLPGKPGT